MPNLTATDYIALASAVIALSAFGTSVWQGYLTRKHNQLSVRPFVGFAFHRTEDTIFRIVIHNYGLGPANLNKLSAKFNNETINLHSIQSLHKLYRYLFEGSTKVDHIYGLFETNSILAPGKENQLIDIRSVENFDTIIFNAKLKLIEFTLNYSCIYGNSFTLSACPSAHLQPDDQNI